MRVKPALLTLACCALLLLAADSPPKQESLRLELFVNDLERSIAFYQNALGFTLERRDGDYAALRLGEAAFGIGSAKGLPESHFFNPELQSQRRGLGTEIVIEVPNLDAALARCTEAQATILSGITKRPWGQSDFRISDPDGYYLRLSSQK